MSDRSRGTRSQAHAVRDCWCNPGPKPSSRHGGGGARERSGQPGGLRPGLACPSCPTPSGGGTYCRDCGLAPSGWRRRISRPSLSTPGAGTEPPSARRRCPAASPRVRPPPTRSPARWRPRCCRRCDCRRRRCRHCALPASPAARMRSVTPGGLGCGWVGPEAGVAPSPAAPAGGCCGCRRPVERPGRVSAAAAAPAAPCPLMGPRAAKPPPCSVRPAARRRGPGCGGSRARLRLWSPSAVAG